MSTMKNTFLKKEPALYQANVLIRSGQSISLQAKKMIYFMAKRIDPNSDEPRKIMVSWKEFEEFVNSSGKRWDAKKRIVNGIVKNLNDNPIRIEKDSDEEYAMINWIGGIRVKNDMVQFNFSEEVMPFLMYLKGQPYTEVIYSIGDYKSIFTVRVKEVLETYLFTKQAFIDIPIPKLRFWLGLEDKYPNLKDFKRRCLNVARDELKETNSLIQYTYEVINRQGKALGAYGKKAYAIRFYITDNRYRALALSNESKPDLFKNTNTDYRQLHEDLFQKLIDWGGQERVVNDLFCEYGVEQVAYQINYTQRQEEANRIKGSTFGYFYTALKNNYKDPVQDKEKKSKVSSKKRASQAAKVEALEEKKKAIRKEWASARKELADQLLQKDTTLLNKLIKAARKEGKSSLLSADKTDEAIYQSKLTQGMIINMLEVWHPKGFEELSKKYQPQIDKLK